MDNLTLSTFRDVTPQNVSQLFQNAITVTDDSNYERHIVIISVAKGRGVHYHCEGR